MYYSAVCPSPLGMLTLGSDGEHLIGLWLEGQKYFGGAVREALEERDGLPVFDAIIIPCHRVVGSGGSLTGYAGGIAAKLRLLEHEGVELSRLSVPKRGTAL